MTKSQTYEMNGRSGESPAVSEVGSDEQVKIAIENGNGLGPTDNKLAEGCVVLGMDNEQGQKYVTRYRINHSVQRKNMNGAVMQEECAPCSMPDNRQSCRDFLWNFVKSEAFLFTLHITALSFGVAKEAIPDEHMSENLELMHSLIETCVAVLMISIRMVVGYRAFREVKKAVFQNEHFVGDKTKIRGRRVRFFKNFMLAVGVTLILVAIGCFLLFFYAAHLGWTILSNNFCMVVFTAVSGVFMTRIAKNDSQVKGDQQKAVLFEALLLLKESAVAHNENEFTAHHEKSGRFLKALEGTSCLERPDHITIEDKYSLKYDMLTAMEMQSV